MKISFIGGGNMGEAIIQALIVNNLALPKEIAVADVSPQRLDWLNMRYAVMATPENLQAASYGDVVVLAVKPQHLAEAAATLTGQLRPEQLVLSIIAGKKMATIQAALQHRGVVRAMPNTPAQIGKGMTVWTAAPEVNDAGLEAAQKILGAMGATIFTDDESVLDMATALSGSGPAYVFLFMEALIEAGVDIGLTPETASALTLQTVLGSAEFAGHEKKDLIELRRMVTSPGGTTAAAVKVFEEKGFKDVIKQAVSAAFHRAQQLGS